MSPRKPLRRALAATESLLIEIESGSVAEPWFVYLFALTDCTAFKVGFSCNPLQRICTFSRRFFERFDIQQSLLFQVNGCDRARVLEAIVKTEFASHRVDVPTWVPREAAGHTEWFSAVYFGDAEARLRSSIDEHENSCVLNAFEVFCADLHKVRSSFEAWAMAQAQRATELRGYAERGYAVRDCSTAVRDWVDAYRYFDVPLFLDDPSALELVSQTIAAQSGLP